MDYYLDIRIKPDCEIRENLLLNKVYTKLHKALCNMKSTDIGVSFPEYRILLGRVIRLHAAEEQLKTLMEQSWLGGLIWYCQISGVSPVPEVVKYRILSRVQSNMTEAKLRRLINRKSITESEFKAYRKKMFVFGLSNPYLELESVSNTHKYRRYINFSELYDIPSLGSFDQFGLSKTATVPWF